MKTWPTDHLGVIACAWFRNYSSSLPPFFCCSESRARHIVKFRAQEKKAKSLVSELEQSHHNLPEDQARPPTWTIPSLEPNILMWSASALFIPTNQSREWGGEMVLQSGLPCYLTAMFPLPSTSRDRAGVQSDHGKKAALPLNAASSIA